MGVPKFYRWLSERYPLINQLISSAAILPEFDNFYLDMNGIIHACTHPNNDVAANSLTVREMMLSIFRYVDRIVSEIVKPKKLLFLAIDGVAPRAKLNQQRARRFRAAQDRLESIEKAKQRGDMIDEENLFDSNCITPGTEFMETVSRHLKYFIRKKVKEDPLWQNLTIIFSGHDVPGEGEHKIMQYIRDMRCLPNYEPNLRHCMYGQDADLIMLGLASHEPHFALLREVIHFNTFKGKKTSAREVIIRQTKDAQFQLLHLSVLREYLIIDFAHGIHHSIDQERIIDDFIFMTFLVGNDFLPHLPTLDISENAFDVLLAAYRQLFQAEPGYIVGKGEIEDFQRLESLCKLIGAQEQAILSNREIREKEFLNKKKKREQITEEDEMALEETEEALQTAFEDALYEAMHGEGKRPEDSEGGEDDEEEEPEEGDEENENAPKTSATGPQKDYRGRYYYEKFTLVAKSVQGEKALENLMVNYLKGLMWCLAYYMKGCISWTWYYPFHYGPMLQDMKHLQELSNRMSFPLGEPFTPFQQLLGCLPPASSNLLPKCYQWLMVNKESPIFEFYPLDFGIDQDGKKNPWEAVVLLDFIDEKRVLAAESEVCLISKLTKSEYLRNKFGHLISYSYDPSIIDTYLSCNPEINLPDIYHCHSKTSELNYTLTPGHHFKPELVEGTVYPIPGFPSLTLLSLSGIDIKPVKLNIFGSESRYHTVVLSFQTPPAPDAVTLKSLENFLGSNVYVNYPQIHEGKVVGISLENEEILLDDKPNADGTPKITHVSYYEDQAKKWKTEAEIEQARYLSGRGLPGSGGMDIGEIKIKFKVQLLQGLNRDPLTGATKKVFSANTVAEIPVQLVLTSLPTPDPRFEEVSELPLERLMPVGAPVIAITGQLIGCSGTIVGPHKALKSLVANNASASRKKQQVNGSVETDAGHTNAATINTSNTTPHHRQLTSAATSAVAPKRKVVDVEFRIPQPEPPFGYNIARSITEDYYSTREVCGIIKISPSTLGKIVGSLRIDPNRIDIGLNLKRKGMYQLLGYVKKVEGAASKDNNNKKDGNNAHESRQTWAGVDTVKLITMENDNSNQAEESEAIFWEYSTAAILLLAEYKYRFPVIFDVLDKIAHKPVYHAKDFYSSPSEEQFPALLDWMKSQPFFALPRTPFTTVSLPQ
jgi:5'-3' exoribonuclease 1